MAVVMGMEQTVTDLMRMRQRLESDELIRNLGSSLLGELSASLDSSLATETGHLRAGLLENSGPVRTGSGWSFGAGSVERLGSPTEPSPQGTISQFLEWYRQVLDVRAASRRGIARQRGVLKVAGAGLAAEEASATALEHGVVMVTARGRAVTLREAIHVGRSGESMVTRMMARKDRLINLLGEGALKGEAETRARGQLQKLLITTQAIVSRETALIDHLTAISLYRRQIALSKERISGYKQRPSLLSSHAIRPTAARGRQSPYSR
jgi:hypothetical protein